MKDRLDQITRRARQYWFSDGLGEIGLGLFLLLLGAYFGLQVRLPEGSGLRSLLDSIFILVFLGGFYGVRFLVQAAKARLTYPRTGYVAYQRERPETWGRRIFAMLAAMILAGLGILFAALTGSLAWLAGLTGLLFAALILALIAIPIGLLRFYLLALVSAGLGVGLRLAGLGDLVGLAWYYAGMGAAVLVSGLAALGLYLHGSRPAQEGADA
jgi:hypothetical protein